MSRFMSIFVYFFVYLVVAFLASRKKHEKINMFIAILIITIFAGFRYYVGTDFETYTIIYKINSNMPIKQWFYNFNPTSDGLSVYLISRIAYLLGGVNAFFAIFALLTSTFTIVAIKRDYKNINSMLAIFLFLITNFSIGLNIMKQVLAASICFWGLKFVYSKNIKKYILTVLLAMTIHISAFVVIIIYFLWDKEKEMAELNIKKILLIVAILLGVANFKSFLYVLGGRFTSYGNSGGILFNLGFFLNLAWMILFGSFFKLYNKKDIKNSLLIFMYFINILLSLTGFISPILKRIALYFTYPKFILMAQMPEIFVKKERFMIRCFVIMYVIFMFVLSYYIKGDSNIIPYNFKII